MDPKTSADNYSEYFLDSNQPMPKEEEYTCYLCNATYEKGILYIYRLCNFLSLMPQKYVLILREMCNA